MQLAGLFANIKGWEEVCFYIIEVIVMENIYGDDWDGVLENIYQRKLSELVRLEDRIKYERGSDLSYDNAYYELIWQIVLLKLAVCL